MKKSTEELLNALKNCEEFQRYCQEHREDFLDTSLPRELNDLCKKKNIKKSSVIAQAQINEIYGYQIFAGKRRPAREKLLCLLIAMHADLEEAQTLLKHTGYAQLYAKDPSDSAVIYGLCKGLSVPEVNEILYDYGLELL